VTRIDPATNGAVATIEVADANRDASVSSVDTASGKVTATVKSGVEPRGIAAHDGAAWVANTVSGKVAVVEP
jgi:YVTN family beta-propeller protein